MCYSPVLFITFPFIEKSENTFTDTRLLFVKKVYQQFNIGIIFYCAQILNEINETSNIEHHNLLWVLLLMEK